MVSRFIYDTVPGLRTEVLRYMCFLFHLNDINDVTIHYIISVHAGAREVLII